MNTLFKAVRKTKRLQVKDKQSDTFLFKAVSKTKRLQVKDKQSDTFQPLFRGDHYILI